MPRSKIDRSLLEAALVGFGHKLGDVTLQINEIKRMLGVRQTAGEPSPKKRKISAAARKRISAATRKRWAEYRAKKAKLR